MNFVEFELYLFRMGEARDSKVMVVAPGLAGLRHDATLQPDVFAPLLDPLGLGRRLSREQVARLGEELFERVFSEEISAGFVAQLKSARDSGKGLRLRLRTDASLLGFPFEAMRHREWGYLCRQRGLSVVRSLEGRRVEEPRRTSAPRILMILADPRGPGLDPLQTAVEANSITEALKESGFEIARVEGPGTRRELERLGGGYDVVHVMGHGSADAHIALVADDGSPDWVNAEDFFESLPPGSFQKLLFLNCCHSASNAAPRGGHFSSFVRAFSVHAPAVIAMGSRVSDTAAHGFAHTFYRHFGGGQSLEEAIVLSRRAMERVEKRDSARTDIEAVEWVTPQLYLNTSSTATIALGPASSSVEELYGDAVRSGEPPRRLTELQRVWKEVATLLGEPRTGSRNSSHRVRNIAKQLRVARAAASPEGDARDAADQRDGDRSLALLDALSEGDLRKVATALDEMKKSQSVAVPGELCESVERLVASEKELETAWVSGSATKFIELVQAAESDPWPRRFFSGWVERNRKLAAVAKLASNGHLEKMATVLEDSAPDELVANPAELAALCRKLRAARDGDHLAPEDAATAWRMIVDRNGAARRDPASTAVFEALKSFATDARTRIEAALRAGDTATAKAALATVGNTPDFEPFRTFCDAVDGFFAQVALGAWESARSRLTAVADAQAKGGSVLASFPQVAWRLYVNDAERRTEPACRRMLEAADAIDPLPLGASAHDGVDLPDALRLLRVHDQARIRTVRDRLRKVGPSTDPRAHLEDLYRELRDDLGLFLLLVGHGEQATDFFRRNALEHPHQATPMRELAVASLACAFAHRRPGAADLVLGPLGSLLCDDARWMQAVRELGRAGKGPSLDQAVAACRKLLSAWGGDRLEAALQNEIEVGKLLAARGGLATRGGGKVAVGPIGMELFDLRNEFVRTVGSLAALADPESETSDWRATARLRVSPLGIAFQLLEADRPEKALDELVRLRSGHPVWAEERAYWRLVLRAQLGQARRALPAEPVDVAKIEVFVEGALEAAAHLKATEGVRSQLRMEILRRADTLPWEVTEDFRTSARAMTSLLQRARAMDLDDATCSLRNEIVSVQLRLAQFISVEVDDDEEARDVALELLQFARGENLSNAEVVQVLGCLVGVTLWLARAKYAEGNVTGARALANEAEGLIEEATRCGGDSVGFGVEFARNGLATLRRALDGRPLM